MPLYASALMAKYVMWIDNVWGAEEGEHKVLAQGHFSTTSNRAADK